MVITWCTSKASSSTNTQLSSIEKFHRHQARQEDLSLSKQSSGRSFHQSSSRSWSSSRLISTLFQLETRQIRILLSIGSFTIALIPKGSSGLIQTGSRCRRGCWTNAKDMSLRHTSHEFQETTIQLILPSWCRTKTERTRRWPSWTIGHRVAQPTSLTIRQSKSCSTGGSSSLMEEMATMKLWMRPIQWPSKVSKSMLFIPCKYLIMQRVARCRGSSKSELISHCSTSMPLILLNVLHQLLLLAPLNYHRPPRHLVPQRLSMDSHTRRSHLESIKYFSGWRTYWTS